MIKKGDIILACALIAVSVALMLLFMPHGGEGGVIVIKHGGEEIYRGPLSIDKTVTIGGEYENTVVISGGEVYFSSSTCPGHDCVAMGHIHEAGRMLACAPNGTIVMIEGTQERGGADAIAN